MSDRSHTQKMMFYADNGNSVVERDCCKFCHSPDVDSACCLEYELTMQVEELELELHLARGRIAALELRR